MGEKKSILVVEDDSGIREAIRIFLEIEGYHVITASNGKEGLEALSKVAKVNVILLDLMMPVMTGWEFEEALRNTKFADTPLIVVTAYAEKLDAIKSNGIIKKPIDLDTLLRMVKRWI